jgi:3-deoxy-manno-octulosonate cytidylyltransferase (CMP-KDO synthetase)
MAKDILVVIPARMAATRLPGKPLADIAGQPMIVHVLRRAEAAAVGPVVVATDSEEIAAAVQKAGGRAVMTRADHVSGSDRVFEALEQVDPQGRVAIVVNVQGDLPTLSPQDIRAALGPLADPAVDIATIAAEITDPAERGNPNVVKVVGSPVAPMAREDGRPALMAREDGRPALMAREDGRPALVAREDGRPALVAREDGRPALMRLRALYFTRATAPSGDGPLYHHIGLYAYRRAALKRFVELPPSPLEQREKLEQLRALEAGMRIDVAIVGSVPLGVDTPEELERARKKLSKTSS